MQKYRRVTYEDRCHISALLQANLSILEISKRLGFHKSTIYREVHRNRCRRGYQPGMATEKAYKRFSRCRRPKLLTSSLKDKIVVYLEFGWSPEQIVGRFRKEGLAIVSRQTIYRTIGRRDRAERRLLRTFGRRGAGRRLQKRAKAKRKRLISDRPTIAEQRRRIGDWERDAMYGANRKQLLVLTDRKSRLTKLEKMESPHRKHVSELTVKALSSLGKRVFSVTNDNGTEFGDGMNLEYKTYFCDPLCPHQRGSVENAIGLLRQYLKRTTDFTKLNQSDLKELESRLNFRPRKCLDYKTPHEVFFKTKVALAM